MQVSASDIATLYYRHAYHVIHGDGDQAITPSMLSVFLVLLLVGRQAVAIKRILRWLFTTSKGMSYVSYPSTEVAVESTCR
jgi:hypothetical protein